MTKKKVVEKSKTEFRLEEQNAGLLSVLVDKDNELTAIKDLLERKSVEVNSLNHHKNNLQVTNSRLAQEIIDNKVVIGDMVSKLMQLRVAFHSTLQLNSSLQHDFVDVIGKVGNDGNHVEVSDARSYFRSDDSV